jgi:hypothetical protein
MLRRDTIAGKFFVKEKNELARHFSGGEGTECRKNENQHQRQG